MTPAERDVQRHSAELRKELRLTDLVLIQVLYIVGLGWIGTAARLGPSHVMFWLPAVLLFYLPSGMVVVHLSREMPLEGGMYQWAKLRFGELAGFLLSLNLWVYTLILISETGVIAANNLAYAAGPRGAWIAESKWIIIGLGAAVVAGLIVVAIRGLSLGRWIHDLGGIMLIALFAIAALLAIPHWLSGHAASTPLAFTPPAANLYNLNILGKMAFGALSGFESVAVFAGEYRTRDAARSISQSVWLAAPLVTAMFVAGTAFVLVFSRPEEIDLVSPIAQIISRGTEGWSFGRVLAPAILIVLIAGRVAQNALQFNVATRLPMVAGWDRLLPEWFSRLHPRHKTPVGAILFSGALTLIVLLMANAGVASQEAYQLLNNGCGIMYGLTYLVMFAIPLWAPGEKPAWSVRAAALSGFVMTALYVTLSVFPIIAVKNPLGFTLKVGGTVAAVNLAGGLYFRQRRKRNAG